MTTELAANRVVCAWCGKVLAPGPEPASHGICARCAEGVAGEVASPRATCGRCRQEFEGKPGDEHGPIVRLVAHWESWRHGDIPAVRAVSNEQRATGGVAS